MLGYVDIDGDPNLPGHEECMIRDPETGHRLLFIEVPDVKAVKNRLHLDLRPRSATRDEELETLLAHGATVVDHRGELRPRHRRGWCSPTPRATSSASCARRAADGGRSAHRRLPVDVVGDADGGDL